MDKVKSKKGRLASILAKLTPRVDVHGLQISDSLVRFQGSNRAAKSFALRLPPGAVVDGKVAKPDVLIKTLIELHSKVSSKPRKGVSVILTIPVNNVYIQPFDLPIVAADNLAESAELNMRMISPIKLEGAYYDWQRVPGGDTQDQIKMAGAFIAKEVVDDFLEAVQSAGFNAAAVEFNTLGIARGAYRYGFADPQKSQLFLELTTEGINFAASHKGSLYFHHFSPWSVFKDVQKKVSVERVKAGLADEVRKMINFYSTTFKTGEVKDVLLVGSELINEAKDSISKSFKDMVVNTASTEKLNPALGAALRGAKPRSQDVEFSLASLSAVGVFRKNQTTNFIVIWRNIFFTTFGALLVVFISSAVVLQNTEVNVVSRDPFASSNPNNAELVELEAQADEFNSLLSLVLLLEEERLEVHPVLEKLDEVMDNDVFPRRISIDSGERSVSMSGEGASESRVIDFKDALSSVAGFEGVRLPLSDIDIDPEGRADFGLSFTIGDIDF